MFILAGNAILIFLMLTGYPSASHSADYKGTHIVKSGFSTPLVLSTPTTRPTLTPTPSPTPTIKPSPTPKPPITTVPTSAQPQTNITSTPPDVNTNDVGQNLLNQVNSFRAGKGLSAFSTNGYACAFAVTRANEITSNFSHEGFRSRIESHTLPYPSYSSIGENIAMYSSSDQVIQAWIDSPEHNENLSKEVPFACIGKSGNYYVFESWKP